MLADSELAHAASGPSGGAATGSWLGPTDSPSEPDSEALSAGESRWTRLCNSCPATVAVQPALARQQHSTRHMALLRHR